MLIFSENRIIPPFSPAAPQTASRAGPGCARRSQQPNPRRKHGTHCCGPPSGGPVLAAGDQSAGNGLPQDRPGAVEVCKPLLHQIFPGRFPRQLIGKLKALDDPVPRNIPGILLILEQPVLEPRQRERTVLFKSGELVPSVFP